MFEGVIRANTIVRIDRQQFSKQIVHTIRIDVIWKIRIEFAVLAETIEQLLLTIVTLLLKICTSGIVVIVRSILDFLSIAQANAQFTQVQWPFLMTDAHIAPQCMGRFLYNLISKHGDYFGESIVVITALEKRVASG